MAKTLDEIQRQRTIGTDPPSDDTDINTGNINAQIAGSDDDFNPTQSQIQEAVKFIKRGHESGLINDTTQSSIVIRHNGQINLSSSRYAQYKINPTGKTVEESLESLAVTNRRKVQTDDMILNEHKLNPYLYELTDIKKLTTAYNDDMVVGNFCLFGSVLTLAWEMNLKRYVLIRRPARIPMFSPMLNIPEINTGLGVTDPFRIDEDLLAKSTKGYQVNAVVSDSKSLIGKEGQSRWGNTNADVSFGGTGSSLSGAMPEMQDVNIAGANDEVPRTDVPDSIPHAALANKIGELSGCNKRLCWAQMWHETGNFNSPLLRSGSHNYAGVKISNPATQKSAGPAPDGGTYRWFDSDDDYAQYQGGANLKAYAQYDGLDKANTPSQFAQCLQHGGYFQALLEEYINGLVNGIKKIPVETVKTTA